MTAIDPTSHPDLRLDRRWFAAFLLLQMALLAAALLLPSKLLYIGLGGIGGGLFLVALLLYPWLIVPALVTTTALDITGKVIETTALGIPLTGFHLSLGLMLVSLVANAFLRRRFTFPAFELGPPLILFLGIMAVSLIYSPNQPEATIGFMRTLVLIIFLYATQVLIDSRAAVHLVVISMVLAMIGGSVLGVVQIITERFYLPASFVIAVGANAPRATGTFHNPNTFGTFMMVGVVFLFAILLHYRTARWKQLFLLIALGMGLAGLVTTFSRANWLASLAGFMLALFMAKKLRYLFLFSGVGFLVILAVKEFVPFAEHIFLRFASIFTLISDFGQLGRESSSSRVFFVVAGLKMFMDHPLLGAGWRAFPVLFDYYKPADFPFWIPTKESHTLFANILAELGLLGLLASGWLVWRVLGRGFSGLKRMDDPYLRAVTIGLLCVFISFQISLSFTADFSNNFLWFFTGMLFAVLRLGEAQNRADRAAGA